MERAGEIWQWTTWLQKAGPSAFNGCFWNIVRMMAAKLSHAVTAMYTTRAQTVDFNARFLAKTLRVGDILVLQQQDTAGDEPVNRCFQVSLVAKHDDMLSQMGSAASLLLDIINTVTMLNFKWQHQLPVSIQG